MVQHQIKLRLKKKQESFCNEWLFMLSGVYNWAIRKIEQDRHGGIYYTKLGFQNLLADHGPKIGIPSHTIQGVLLTAHESWRRYFKKLGGKPKLKSKRNKLTSIPFPDPIRLPTGNHVKLPGLGVVRFHKQELPEGKIKCGRIIKRASGWYLCLFIDTQPKAIPHAGASRIGIDPGFNNLLTLSTGEKIQHPRELEAMAQRLAQAQRGNRRRFASRIQERIANQRKDRNHKLSRRLVAENELIVFSADSHKGIANRFGKSVASSSHYQLRQMLAYKAPTSGRRYVEVDPKYSTMTCSACGCISGPTGLAGLSVRGWCCVDCGMSHDRDVNAAINTLVLGAGTAHELCRPAA